VIAVAVMVVALLALMSALFSASTLQETTREKSLAYNAARQTLETMRNSSFSSIFSTYKSGTPQNQFLVAGLNAIPGTPVGQIFFPEGPGGTLREDFFTLDSVMATALGVPSPGKDLNDDGLIDAADHGADYKILPVLVRISWQSTGRRGTHIDVATFITVK
jgi:hypothetical protein